MKYSTIRFNAGNDSNGNQRRVFVTFCNGDIVATYDEEYSGVAAIRNRYHRAGYQGITIATTPADYREFLRFGAQAA